MATNLFLFSRELSDELELFKTAVNQGDIVSHRNSLRRKLNQLLDSLKNFDQLFGWSEFSQWIIEQEASDQFADFVRSISCLNDMVNQDNDMVNREDQNEIKSTKPKVFSKGYALLIGVGADLPVTVNDAKGLQDVLVDSNRAAYPSEQVKCLTENSATRQTILEKFEWLIERVNQDPDATVIVYYSGHGGRFKPTNEYFLVPYGYSPSKRAKTAISGLEFTKKIEAIKARKLVVILDCCHAGGVPALKEMGEAFAKSPVPPELLTALGESE